MGLPASSSDQPIVVSFLRPGTEVLGKARHLAYRIDLGFKRYDCYFDGERLPRDIGLEAGLIMALLAGMRTGRNIYVKGAVSETFLKGVREYVEVFSGWFSEFRRVEIMVESAFQAKASSNDRVASFFSGGVDSFFTLFKHKSEINDIIYIYGFDVRLDDWPRREAISAMGRSVARELGKDFIEIETNYGAVMGDFGAWAQHAHGLALAVIARCLAGEVRKVFIPSTLSLNEQRPWGSTPVTDPLFSDECVAVVHDACEARRVDKVVAIAYEPLAQKFLRVCWERPEGLFNCCECEKCVRTMVSLHALGVLEHASSFPLPLTASKVRGALILNDAVRSFSRENLDLLCRMGMQDSPLVNVLEVQIRRPIWVAKQLRKWRKRRQRVLKNWDKALSKINVFRV